MNSNIIECFTSMQGEGRYQGTSCCFIRFSGCNLRCRWCDTKYAQKIFSKYSIEEVINIANESSSQRVSITGGEPLLYPETIKRLVKNIHKPITIETNGSYPLIKDLWTNANWSLDWKTPSSGCQITFEENNLQKMGFDDWIKFVVVDKKTDLPFIKENILKIPSRIEVFIQTDYPDVEVANYIINENLRARYSFQLHKLLWKGEKQK